VAKKDHKGRREQVRPQDLVSTPVKWIALTEVYPPDSPEALLQEGLESYQAGRYKDCITASQRALAVRPGYALAYNNICAAYNQLESWRDAIKACEKALGFDPELERARNNLEWARSRQEGSDRPDTGARSGNSP
jgi:tetratricopeptide (TPR) repeat protein